MPIFTPWEGSPEQEEAKKAADDISRRLTTVKADSQRIMPKLGTYKKETLERLVKETKASYDAAVKKTKEFSNRSPERIYIQAVETEERTQTRTIMKEAETKVNAIKTESKKYTAAASAFKTNGPQAMAFRLGEAYLMYLKALQKELAVATKENGAAKRTI